MLERSLEVDPSNSSAQSLQRNVDVFKGRAKLDAGEELVANRVRELARAKSGGAQRAQAAAESAYRSAVEMGDFEAASSAGSVLLAITEDLAALEQSEAVDQKVRLEEVRGEIAQLASSGSSASVESGKKQESKKTAARGPIGRDSLRSLPGARDVTILFDSADITGTLMQPEGAVFAGNIERDKEAGVTLDGLDDDLQAGEVAFLFDVEGRAAPFAAPVAAPVAAPAAVTAVTAKPMSPPPPSDPAPPDPEPMPVEEEEQDAEMGWADSPADVGQMGAVSETMVIVSRVSKGEVAIDADEAQQGVVLTQDFLERVPAGRSYQTVVQMAPGVASSRRRARQAPTSPSPPPPPPPPPETFPQGPVAADPHPTAGQPLPSHPAHAGSGLTHPRRGWVAAPAWPQRPPPPPAAAWGLEVPTHVEASTLSLSLPETGTGLRVEQRLVPAGEPLSLDLSYRFRSRR